MAKLQLAANLMINKYHFSFIPRSLQLQIFQRSFSTKGNGRGLGTYSIKFLTEKYLKAKVSFLSNENDGNTFKVDLPLELIN